MESQKKDIGRRGFLIAAGSALASPAISGAAATGQPLSRRVLGRTGLSVSPVGFGTVHTDRPNVVKRVIDSGVNFIDTGRMYANGKNEEMIGSVIKSVRKDIVLQTKFTSKAVDDAKAVEKSIDDSLRALGTDYIDILLIHSVSTLSELRARAAHDAMSRAKEQGKIRFTGFSSHSGLGCELLREARTSGFFDVALVPYNHAGYFDHTVYRGFHVDWNQKELEKEIEKAAEAGMGIAAMKTCSAGPYRGTDDEQKSFPNGLRWILKNKNIATMAVCMSSFREVADDVAVMNA